VGGLPRQDDSADRTRHHTERPNHELAIAARRYAFEPATLQVHQGDLIRITLRTQDIPHSFVSDALRIARKATPDRAVSLLFVDRPGVFSFYNLAPEDGCRQMRGQLVVQPEAGGDSLALTPEDFPRLRNPSQSAPRIMPPGGRLSNDHGDWFGRAAASGLLRGRASLIGGLTR
jgi:plastocyanin